MSDTGPHTGSSSRVLAVAAPTTVLVGRSLIGPLTSEAEQLLHRVAVPAGGVRVLGTPALVDGVLVLDGAGRAPVVDGADVRLVVVAWPVSPERLAEVRRRDGVDRRTPVVAIGPARPDLTSTSSWGVRAVSPGGVVDLSPGVSATRTLVLGGARSGKSARAELLLAAEPAVTYVATGQSRPDDADWARRVDAHRSRRPAAWATVETLDLVTLLSRADAPLLIDCLSLWLSATMDRLGCWSEVDPGAADARLESEIAALASAWRTTAVPVVAVSSEVGSGVVPATVSGRRFRDALGRLNAVIAAGSDVTELIVAGRVLRL